MYLRVDIERQLMELVEVSIERQLDKRLRILINEKMDEIVHQVVKRAVPEISYRLIQDGYQADQAKPGSNPQSFQFAPLDYFGLPGPPGSK